MTLTWSLVCSGAPGSLGYLQGVPSSIQVGVSSQITFLARITDPTFIPGSALLQELDTTDRVIKTLGKFHDDGLYGDLIAGDGYFTLRVPILRSSAGTLVYKASAAFRGSLYRVSSFSLDILATSSPPSFGAQVLGLKDALLFLNRNGDVVARIPLVSSTVDSPDRIRTFHSDQTAISKTRECVAILSETSELFLDPGETNDTADVRGSR